MKNGQRNIKQTSQGRKWLWVFIVFVFGGIIGYVINGSGYLKKATVNDQPIPQQKLEEPKLPETNCEAVEELLKQTLNKENTTNYWSHYENVKIYQRIVQQGCEKNREKYLKLAQREFEIAKALDTEGELARAVAEEKVPVSTCEKIEFELSRQLNCNYNNSNCGEEGHISDAKIYANLSERGCQQNSEKYKALAKQELEIARALSDDNMDHQHEMIEIVETYKRLQMQAEAERIIEKAKKIANPAIDFIIQLEQIIEESKDLLCENGKKPDVNGCCDGEVYTDAGGGWMVCCPDGGDNCFPPMK